MSIGVTEPVTADAIPDVGGNGAPVAACYEVGKQCYWVPDSRGDWIKVNESSIKRQLKTQGFSAKVAEGEYASLLDKKLVDIQLKQNVAYAGALAGYFKGLVETCGNRVLVANSPRIITPQKGDWPIIGKLIENLLTEPNNDQRPYLFGWLKFGVEALHSGSRRPGQVLAMAGEHACGKSLLQNLFTEMLGGRAAKPYRYMSGRTTFNGDLFGAEHLMIEDEAPSTDIRARRNLGTKIKAFAANESHSCHPKGLPAFTAKPFWRVSITLNDEPENLMILPPLDESLTDKIILLRARKAPMPMPTHTYVERNAFWAALISELPAFLHFLQEWTVPGHLRCSRYGVCAYQHPALLAAIDVLAPETRLLNLIDEVLFSECQTPGALRLPKPDQSHVMTAEQLQNTLCQHGCTYTGEAKQLLSWANATGTYLGRLAKKHPERVRQHRTADSRHWEIHPPCQGCI